MSRITRDSYVAIVLILISVIALWGARDLNKMSAIFPRTIATILLILSVIYLIVSLIKKPEGGKAFAGIDKKIVLSMCGGMVGYVILIWLISFLVASLIFIGFFVWFLQDSSENGWRPRLFSSVISSVVVSIGFYLLFEGVFNVPLPRGIFF